MNSPASGGPSGPPYVAADIAQALLCVAFIAAPHLHADEISRWPVLWARDVRHGWREVDLDQSAQARRLACLLVTHPAGLAPGAVGLALDRVGGGKGARQNAAGHLREALEQVGLSDLFPKGRGGRGSPPWVLRQATTDIGLAVAAAAAEHWTDAAALTHGGEGILVGIPEPVGLGEHWKDAVPLAARHASVRALRGKLPAELLDNARRTAQQVRGHRSAWEHAGAEPSEDFGVAPRPAATDVTVDDPCLDIVKLDRRHRRSPASAPARPDVPRTLADLAGGRAVLVVLRPDTGRAPHRAAVIPLAAIPEPAARWPGRHQAWIGRGVVSGILAAAFAFILLGTGRATKRPGHNEQESPNHRVATFIDPFSAAGGRQGQGVPIPAGTVVRVSCRIYAPQIESVNPDGYWYRIGSAPWSGHYYSPANTFLNGDPAHGPYTHNTDFSVPKCNGTVAVPPVPTQPPSATYSETTGAATRTSPSYVGPTRSPGVPIAQNATIRVSCKVIGSRAPAGERWWYRIASSPWSGAYYASAGTFYNDGQRSGRLDGSPHVDPDVPFCSARKRES